MAFSGAAGDSLTGGSPATTNYCCCSIGADTVAPSIFAISGRYSPPNISSASLFYLLHQCSSWSLPPVWLHHPVANQEANRFDFGLRAHTSRGSRWCSFRCCGSSLSSPLRRFWACIARSGSISVSLAACGFPGLTLDDFAFDLLFCELINLNLNKNAMF